MQNQPMADRLKTTPVSFTRTVRPDVIRTVTSGDAGFAIPLGFIPLLREDALETTQVQLRAYMAETADLLLNTVHCVFSAYAVPKLAFDRFGGSMDALNRAYMGQPEMDGSYINWNDLNKFTYSNGETPRNIYEVGGFHAPDPANVYVNSDYAEAYDKVFEYRCRSRSEALWEVMKVERPGLAGLLPAFFDNDQMGIVKPTFDAPSIEGEVPLNVVDGRANVRADAVYTVDGLENLSALDGNGDNTLLEAAGGGQLRFKNEPGTAVGQLFTEMQEQGLTISVANINLAREMQGWAKVRQQYSGLDDDQLTDLLMSGVAVPTAYATKPILLARQKVPFGMTQRYSSDAENLDVSATNGVAGAAMTLRTPQMNTGGVVVIMAEVVPEQFWERSADYHFLSDNDTRRPDRLLDQLDAQPVEIVENFHVDVAHTDPNGLFGYAPLNHGYVRKSFNLGGKFYRGDPLAVWSEDRNRVWASEPIDPTLSKEMYLATDLPKEIFLDANQDSFEFSMACDARVSGLTYIGPMLRESIGDYDAISERVDRSLIAGDGTDGPAAAQNEQPEQQDDEAPVAESETDETPTENDQ